MTPTLALDIQKLKDEQLTLKLRLDIMDKVGITGDEARDYPFETLYIVKQILSYPTGDLRFRKLRARDFGILVVSGHDQIN